MDKMDKMVKMPSIGKFSDVVRSIERETYYVETLEDGTIVTDETRKLPTIDFTATVKLHGTFAGIVYDCKTDEIYAESKGNVITPQNDNAGFAFFVESNKEAIRKLRIEHFNTLNPEFDKIALMGEWVGPGIQKGVGINQIPEKTFFVFGIKWTEEDGKSYWARYPESVLNFVDDNTPDRIRSIFKFPFWNYKVDFNKPKAVLEFFDLLRDIIDAKCPVAEAYGISGHGEGFVAVGWYDGERYTFKHKGESHSKSQKEPKVRVQDPKMQEKINIAEKLTPVWRLEQASQEVNDLNNGGHQDIKNMGSVIKWVLGDIIKEESTEIQKAGFEIKELQKYISGIVRDWYKKETERV